MKYTINIQFSAEAGNIAEAYSRLAAIAAAPMPEGFVVQGFHVSGDYGFGPSVQVSPANTGVDLPEESPTKGEPRRAAVPDEQLVEELKAIAGNASAAGAARRRLPRTRLR